MKMAAIVLASNNHYDISNHHTDCSVTTITHDLYYAMHLTTMTINNIEKAQEMVSLLVSFLLAGLHTYNDKRYGCP